MHLRWKSTLAVMAATLMMLLASCTSPEPDNGDVDPIGEESPDVTTGGTLVVALDADPPTLNSIVSNANQAFFASKPIFDTLVEYDEDFQMHPSLAESFEISEDGTRYEFNLVEGALWHDGEAVSAEDVKFTFEYGLENSDIVNAVFGGLDSIETPTDTQVILNFSEPAATAFALLGDPVLNILPKHVYDTPGEAADNPANLEPIGSGPFRFVEWARGEQLVLERNEAYWREGFPRVDRVVFRIIPDPTAAMAALERGDVDYFPEQVEMVDAERLQDSPVVELRDHSVADSVIIAAFNHRVEPFDNPQVREALSLAADRSRMTEQVGFGLGVEARSPVASTSPYFNDDLPPLEHNIDRANELLDDAGFPEGPDGTRFAVELSYVASVVPFAQTAEILRENWQDVGVDVELVGGELSTTLEAVFANWDFDVAVYSVFSGPEPDRRMAQFFGTDNITGAFFSNAMGYSNPEVDELVAQASTIVDFDRRAELYGEVQELIRDDYPVVLLWEDKRFGSFRSEWQEMFPYPDARFNNLARAHRTE